jgi:large subunit ribosomal protein LP0
VDRDSTLTPAARPPPRPPQVGTSEAALLTKLGVKPFQYGLRIVWVFEGAVFSPDVLKITDATLMGIWSAAVGNVAAISLATGFATQASLPHMVIQAAKNVVAIALEADYIEFDLVKKIKEILDSA